MCLYLNLTLNYRLYVYMCKRRLLLGLHVSVSHKISVQSYIWGFLKSEKERFMYNSVDIS